jgi:phosphoribosylamine--glycine ligase
LKILVVGSGGRDHALAWALDRAGGNDVLACPGNPGTAAFALNVSTPADPLHVAVDHGVELVVVGPEAPLAAGLGDRLRVAGIPCFGPDARCAALESSKWFAKEVMVAAGVPTALGEVFDNSGDALAYMGGKPRDWVLKADGLAAGKGVVLPDTVQEAREALDSLLSNPPGRVVVEERLSGPEVSVMAVCSGTETVILPPSRDHKRIGEGETGPNTGGMGAVCPPCGLPDGFSSLMERTVFKPVLRELESRGLDYRGVLYAGMILTPGGPRVLEFNVRFGDPETQAVLPLLGGDLAGLFMAAALGRKLPEPRVLPGASAVVILASAGYPGEYRKGAVIKGLDNMRDAMVFHAGTALSGSEIVASGGRVLGVAASGKDLAQALEKVYGAVDSIHFDGMTFRRDIGRVP